MSTSRRGFLRGMVGVGAGAAAGTGLAGCAPDISPAPVANAEKEGGKVELEVARYPDLSRDGGAITLRVTGEQPVLVMHPSGDTYSVVASTCTHAGCPLGFQDGEAICPCHLSRFALDGKVTHPPALAPLKSYTASFNAGILTIDFAAGEAGFPSVTDGKLVLPFSQFPQLKTEGGVVQGTPGGYGKLIFVFALAGGAYSAVDSICTHAGCAVGYDSAAQDLLCPCHDSRFTKDGTVTQGPALATGPLKKFSVTSDESGVTVSFV
ncbi:ubiquinol-cytochrome c reductase iron-sulfur subunit [Vitiosangium sp. GDMCC 1.1324]|uniref:QcrA and Rieske domain-containing protein n=1 Tax=Vitiosangium sp. (strain GDMCC 1.1324) TaxID=2138576 RepID=UPI000D38360A|nr:Rieske (2Fe-2S) protein [Vitiosangium sp. GDMCC 1.1324]PTL79605.1 (2Fe-2S)-binding protein [Vitiosangium sp. GDMCC 1.1324]